MTDPTTPAQVDLVKLEALAKAATPGPWMSLRDGNQYIETSYLPTAKGVGASRIPEIARPWNPHAYVRFGFRPTEFETARFKDADADFIAAMNPAVALALIAEVRAHREREASGGWRPLLNEDGLLRVDEGTRYLFAIEVNTGWEFFRDAILWDDESDPRWDSGDHGWEIDDVTHYRELPPPAVKEPR